MGNTPLVAMPRLGADLPGEVVAKLEPEVMGVGPVPATEKALAQGCT